MYLMSVYPEFILDSFEIRVKYMQNVKIHVFSWNLTEHVRYFWDTSRYIKIRVSCRIHAGYPQDTSGYVSWITPPPNSITTPPRPDSTDPFSSLDDRCLVRAPVLREPK